jgi:hypothetical protein
MRGRGDIAQTVDHGRKHHISEGCNGALHQVRNRHPEASAQDLFVRAEGLMPGRDYAVPEYGHGDGNPAIGEGER